MKATGINIVRVLGAATIIGKDIENTAGENLGRIEDLMIHLKSGRIAYAIISLSGFSGGTSDTLLALPWEPFTFHEDRMKFTLHVDRERLKDAPSFNKNNWPDMEDFQWGAKIYRYYGYRPYW